MIPRVKLVRLMEMTGLFSVVRRFNAGKTRALLYHRFSHEPRAGFVSRETFRGQIRYLREWCAFPSPDTLLDDARGRRHGVVITIDDGHRDFYEIAYPVLREFDVPAIVYLTTDFIERRTWLWFDKFDYIVGQTKKRMIRLPFGDRGGEVRREDAGKVLRMLKRIPTPEREARLRELSRELDVAIPEDAPDDRAPLQWAQIREMAANGIRFGAHTCTHPILTQTDESGAREEIERSKRQIEERLSRPVRSFAYPNGAFDERIVRLVREAGYEYAFTTQFGFVTPDAQRFMLKRMAIGDIPPVYFRQQVSGVDVLKMRIREFCHRTPRCVP